MIGVGRAALHVRGAGGVLSRLRAEGAGASDAPLGRLFLIRAWADADVLRVVVVSGLRALQGSARTVTNIVLPTSSIRRGRRVNPSEEDNALTAHGSEPRQVCGSNSQESSEDALFFATHTFMRFWEARRPFVPS